MTLDELRINERLLMRSAFERACELAALPLNAGGVIDDGVYARIAAAIQLQVESGITDLDIIAGSAAASLAENSGGTLR